MCFLILKTGDTERFRSITCGRYTQSTGDAAASEAQFESLCADGSGSGGRPAFASVRKGVLLKHAHGQN
jgi:hypothetical protein